jgi:hypothetical protein
MKFVAVQCVRANAAIIGDPECIERGIVMRTYNKTGQLNVSSIGEATTIILVTKLERI